MTIFKSEIILRSIKCIDSAVLQIWKKFSNESPNLRQPRLTGK